MYVLNHLLRTARARVGELTDDEQHIRGVWRTEYVLRLGPSSTPLHLHYVAVQTVKQGCAYFEPEVDRVELSERLIGQKVLELDPRERPLLVAALDAVYASLEPAPQETHLITGTNVDKARWRARIVCQVATEALRAATRKGAAERSLVVVVGVVGEFLDLLSQDSSLKVMATDFNSAITGKSVYGVPTVSGSRTEELVAEADLAIVTGMTLANGTLDGILARARSAGTTLVLFAQTGAHFGREYCKLGVDAVIGEPLPFYLSHHGETTLHVYRRQSEKRDEAEPPRP